MGAGYLGALVLVLGFPAGAIGCNTLAGIEEGILDPNLCEGDCTTSQASGGGSSGGGGGGCIGCTRCSSSWDFEAAERCYRIIAAPQSWNTALQECRKLGGDLSAVGSKEELSLIDQYVNEDVWIGGADKDKEGMFTWSSGEPWSFAEWVPGRPTNKPNNKHDCVKLTGNPAMFTDEVCGTSLPYLCEADAGGP